MIEDTRTKIHAENTLQIKTLSDAFIRHCEENKKTDAKIEKLMPLTNLIPTLETIVEDQKATVYMGRKVLRIIGYIASALGLLYLILQVWKQIK